MRVYLDTCCFNRPFDDQQSLRVRLETEVKLAIQSKIREGRLELVWSYILTFENSLNPLPERRNEIQQWRQVAGINITETPEVLATASRLESRGIKPLDALHIACAIAGGCVYFISVDKGITGRRDRIAEIQVVNPVDFMQVAGFEL